MKAFSKMLVLAVAVAAMRCGAAVFCWKVVDGGTIWVVDDAGVKSEVRLDGIDARSVNQPGGREAADALARLVLGRYVTLANPRKDADGRYIADVFVYTEKGERVNVGEWGTGKGERGKGNGGRGTGNGKLEVEIPLVLRHVTEADPAVGSRTVQLLMRAAEAGDARARSELGVLYCTGSGVKKDAAEAARLFRLAADQGDVNAQYNLGLLYFKGVGVACDKAEAAKWYQRAADSGHVIARFNLGVMYATGNGVPIDKRKGASFYLIAAEAGLAEAQYALALMYAHGRGVAQSDEKAAEWFFKAAAQGHEKAKSALKQAGLL